MNKNYLILGIIMLMSIGFVSATFCDDASGTVLFCDDAESLPVKDIWVFDGMMDYVDTIPSADGSAHSLCVPDSGWLFLGDGITGLGVNDTGAILSFALYYNHSLMTAPYGYSIEMYGVIGWLSVYPATDTYLGEYSSNNGGIGVFSDINLDDGSWDGWHNFSYVDTNGSVDFYIDDVLRYSSIGASLNYGYINNQPYASLFMDTNGDSGALICLDNVLISYPAPEPVVPVVVESRGSVGSGSVVGSEEVTVPVITSNVVAPVSSESNVFVKFWSWFVGLF